MKTYRTSPSTSVTADGVVYRDLNRNGVMDPFEDSRLSIDERVNDLVGRLSLEEKAGLMFIPVASPSPEGDFAEGQQGRPGAFELVTERAITHLNVHAIPEPRLTARWNNRVQSLAEEASPHGIPVTIATDPRHTFAENENWGASFSAGHFSAWPEPLGFAAIGDEDAVREFADIARSEYVAVGLRLALHPTLDLATEPRWARQYSTFGQDADVVARLGVAYVDGFEGAQLGAESVACMAKHFPGGGPQRDGEDPHFPYGREQEYPGGMFEHHLAPFERIVERGVASIMPYYGMPIGLVVDGVEIDELGFSFNEQIITGILRQRLGFDGVVCTDWGLIHESRLFGKTLPPRAWGVEHLSEEDRVLKVIEAGCDQFGGESCSDIIVSLVTSGRVSEERVDQSVRRLLRVKFALGLFDNPFVDEDAAETLVGAPAALEAGHRAQARSVTVLMDRAAGATDPALPLAVGTHVYSEQISAEVIEGAGLIVAATPEEADVAIVRLNAPFDPRDDYMLEASFHAGTLEFDAATVEAVKTLAAATKVIAVVHLDRPAVLTPLLPYLSGLAAVYGASSAAVLDALTGALPAVGRLPFELPVSEAEVVAARPDVPGDTANPLFAHGFGLTLSKR